MFLFKIYSNTLALKLLLSCYDFIVYNDKVRSVKPNDEIILYIYL